MDLREARIVSPSIASSSIFIFPAPYASSRKRTLVRRCLCSPVSRRYRLPALQGLRAVTEDELTVVHAVFFGVPVQQKALLLVLDLLASGM